MMPPTHDLEKDDITIDLSGLAYSLETAYANLLGELAIAIAKYRSAIDAMNLRSALHRGDVQLNLERAGLIEDKPSTLAEIRGALGERLFITLTQATDQAIDAVPKALAEITPSHRRTNTCGPKYLSAKEDN